MNLYWASGLLIAFVMWSGFMYVEGYNKKAALCGEANAQHEVAQDNVTIGAQKGVIATVGKQQTVTQEVDNAYQAKKGDIDNQYAGDAAGVQPVQPAAGSDKHASGSAASRPYAAPARPFITKIFKLNPKECDENTQQLISLQDWVNGQQVIK